MILNGKPINPGELSTQVTLLKRTITTAAGGFQVPGTTTIGTAWAKWTGVHGSEAWTATLNAVEPATVLLRYNSLVDETCLVQVGGKNFEVVSVDDIQKRHEYIELKVKRVEEG